MQWTGEGRSIRVDGDATAPGRAIAAWAGEKRGSACGKQPAVRVDAVAPAVEGSVEAALYFAGDARRVDSGDARFSKNMKGGGSPGEHPLMSAIQRWRRANAEP